MSADEVDFTPAAFEVFRFDVAGNLVYVHPKIVEEVTKPLLDDQGLTVWQRLDACDRALLLMTSQVTMLQQQYSELSNELSLIASIQRTCMDLDKRLTALEKSFSDYTVSRLPTTYAQAPQTYVPFGSIDKLVEQVDSMFDCQDGDRRSCHQVWNYPRGTFDHYRYETVGVIASADLPNAQERLRQAMYTAFHKLKLTCKSEHPVLYWRYAAAGRILEDQEINVKRGKPVRYKIMTRIAIPEANFFAVESLVKTEDGLYSELEG